MSGSEVDTQESEMEIWWKNLHKCLCRGRRSQIRLLWSRATPINCPSAVVRLPQCNRAWPLPARHHLVSSFKSFLETASASQSCLPRSSLPVTTMGIPLTRGDRRRPGSPAGRTLHSSRAHNSSFHSPFISYHPFASSHVARSFGSQRVRGWPGAILAPLLPL